MSDTVLPSPSAARRAVNAVALPELLVFGAILAALVGGMAYNYPFFHAVAELFSVVVALTAFAVAWNTRSFNQSRFLAYIGLSFPAVAMLDLLHAVAYPGMGALPDGSPNTALQLWIAARLIQAGNFLVAPLVIGHKRVSASLVLTVQGLLFALAMLAIFVFDAMPVYFVEGVGLTPLKIATEYAICAVVAVACVLLAWRRRDLDASVFALVLGSYALLIVQELVFTLYRDPDGPLNAFGHVVKILSVYLLYKAIVVTALQKPYELIFYRLRRSEQALRVHLASLESVVAERTTDLRESESRLRDLLECSNDWFWETDAEGRFLSLSSHAGESIGRPVASLVGLDHHDLLRPDLPPEDFSLLVAAMESREPFRRLSYPLATRDGPPRWVLVSGVPHFTADGSFLGYRGTASDITERREAAEAVRRKQTMAALGNLVGGLAHELNNLVQPVVSLSELALDRTPPDDRKLRAYVGAIHESGLKARGILRDVLAFARTEVAESPPGDVAEAIRSAVDIARPGLPPTVAVAVEVPEGLGAVSITATELTQVLLNLIHNARDAMPDGGRLLIRADSVALEAPEASRLDVPAGPSVRLSVSDTGTGMDDATRQRAFDPFFTTKPVGSGTGLGLSVVYGIVRNGGGVISIESSAGKGTTVRIDLPLADATAGSGADALGAEEGAVDGERIGG